MELDQIKVLCKYLASYKFIYTEYNVKQMFENAHVYVIVNQHNNYHILEKESVCKTRIVNFNWNLALHLVDWIEMGIPNVTQSFLLPLKSNKYSVHLWISNCTVITLASYNKKQNI